jgi:hypothetical protein
MEHRSSGDVSRAEQITQLRARVDAGERDAAGPLGELLARRGDQQGAIQVWADAYGDGSPRTKRLAESLVQAGDLTPVIQRNWAS